MNTAAAAGRTPAGPASAAGGWSTGVPAMQQSGGQQPPDPMGEIAGSQQGHEGAAQGGTGAMFGQMTGGYDGIQRAASGGMTPGPYQEILKQLIPTLAGLFSESGVGKHP